MPSKEVLQCWLVIAIFVILIDPSLTSMGKLIPRSKWSTHIMPLGKGIYKTITCEKAIWNSRTVCPRGLLVGNILDAKYGRYMGGDICPYGGYFVDDPPCSIPIRPQGLCKENEDEDEEYDDEGRSLKRKGSKGKEEDDDMMKPCHFQVDDKSMRLRVDPCPRTYKYLTVVFTCIKPEQ